MNDVLRRLADVDPDSARELHRYQKWSRVIAGLAILAVLGTAYAIAVNVDQGNNIVEIQHSACAENPASLECQQIKAESDRKQPIVFACIPIRKIAKDQRLLALTKCQEAASRAERNSGSKGTVPNGGDAQTPSQGQQPSPPKGGHEKGTSEGTPGGTKTVPQSPEAPSHAESPPTAPDTPAVTKPEPEAESPPATPAAPKSPVGQALEPVTKIVCHLNPLGVRICVELP